MHASIASSSLFYARRGKSAWFSVPALTLVCVMLLVWSSGLIFVAQSMSNSEQTEGSITTLRFHQGQTLNSRPVLLPDKERIRQAQELFDKNSREMPRYQIKEQEGSPNLLRVVRRENVDGRDDQQSGERHKVPSTGSTRTSSDKRTVKELDSDYIYRYFDRGFSLDGISSALSGPNTGSDDLYVTFEDDAGGWNNIRMAFECFVLAARLTKRILVLPPKVKFYLLDSGPIKLFEKNQESYSEYSHYFDIDALRRGGLRVITTDEFVKRFPFDNLPESVAESALKDISKNGVHTDWFMYLRSHPETIIWPSGPEPIGEFSLSDPFNLHSIARNKRIIHFPVHISKNLRYLDGAPKLVSKASNSIQQFAKVFVRNHIRYTDDILEAAKKAIERLGGPTSYSCIHIRRNDLQFKDSFLSASDSLSNIKKAFFPEEHIYIATDETEPGFFEAFTDQGFTVSKLQDVLLPTLDSIERKHDGMIEQLICSFARAFVGTSTSTFTSYINRLRMYVWKDLPEEAILQLAEDPDERCWFHDKKYPSSAFKSSAPSTREDCGHVYFTAFDGMFYP